MEEIEYLDGPPDVGRVPNVIFSEPRCPWCPPDDESVISRKAYEKIKKIGFFKCWTCGHFFLAHDLSSRQNEEHELLLTKDRIEFKEGMSDD